MILPIWDWCVTHRRARRLQRHCRVYLDQGALPPAWLWTQSQAAYEATKAPFTHALITLGSLELVALAACWWWW